MAGVRECRRTATSRCRPCTSWLVPALLLAVGGMLQAAEVDFQRDIIPILTQHCLDCHGPEMAEARLRLDTPEHALRGGDSGEPAVVPGNSERSELYVRITHADASRRMPAEAPPLSPEAIDLLRRWIDDAAHWTAAQAALGVDRPQHWAFQPVVRPRPPAGAPHPIDAFLQTRLAAASLEANPRADRRTLRRRLALVMHGLPPTPDDVDSFERDPRDDAWSRLVDEVLASPRYGERWAAYWLDLVHFGETHGFETNRERPHAWRYRDWVIEALNRDLPYDEFVRAQLAGDALGYDVATGFLVAGPYDLVKGQDPLLGLMQRQDELADILNTTGTAFLGLTLGCARCHNHKFDPITQADYYALQAVFAGVQHADRPLPQPAEVQARLATLDAERAALERDLAKFLAPPREPASGRRPPVQPRENVEQFPSTPVRFVRFTIEATHQGEPCLDELELFSGEENVGLASAGATATSGGDFVHPLHKLEHIHDGRYGNARSWIARQATGGWVQLQLPQVRSIDRIVWGRDREGRYQDRLAIGYRIESSLDGATWQVLASSADRQPFSPAAAAPRPPAYDFDAFPAPEAARGRQLLARFEELTRERQTLAEPTLAYAGTFSQPGPTHRLYRGDPTAPREAVAPGGIRTLTTLRLPADTPERERRLAVARWIASPDNPLTARVIANRVWQFHFGTGLVDTPSDFGASGTPPTHPELLDWLAAELVDHGWSLKHLHRLILTSHAWQQSSHPNSAGLAVDAGARLLWRFPPRRLEAEAIRDSLLAVSGVLDLRMGGPGFSAFEIEAENVRHYHPKTSFGPEDWRRMIYMTRVRQERDAVFGVFDCPDCSQVVPQRSRSTTPLQALNLLNSTFVLQQADLFATRLQREAAAPAERIRLAYRLCFSRDPPPDELDEALAFVNENGWTQFARAMLNANEFVFVP